MYTEFDCFKTSAKIEILTQIFLKTFFLRKQLALRSLLPRQQASPKQRHIPARSPCPQWWGGSLPGRCEEVQAESARTSGLPWTERLSPRSVPCPPDIGTERRHPAWQGRCRENNLLWKFNSGLAFEWGISYVKKVFNNCLKYFFIKTSCVLDTN